MIIKKAEYVISSVKEEHYPDLDRPCFIFMGRSNVGKSSLINALTNKKKLAYTSSKPGKTLTLNFYNINDSMYFVDVPGYGYAAKSTLDRLAFGKMIEDFLQKCPTLKTCFLVIDSRHDPTEDDILMYNYLNHYGMNVVIIATKIDKLNRTELTRSKDKLFKLFGLGSKSLIFVSSLTKEGIKDVLDRIETDATL